MHLKSLLYHSGLAPIGGGPNPTRIWKTQTLSNCSIVTTLNPSQHHSTSPDTRAKDGAASFWEVQASRLQKSLGLNMAMGTSMEKAAATSRYLADMQAAINKTSAMKAMYWLPL